MACVLSVIKEVDTTPPRDAIFFCAVLYGTTSKYSLFYPQKYTFTVNNEDMAIEGVRYLILMFRAPADGPERMPQKFGSAPKKRN